VNLLTFQFDQSGGGFVIEIANSTPDIFMTPMARSKVHGTFAVRRKAGKA